MPRILLADNPSGEAFNSHEPTDAADEVAGLDAVLKRHRLEEDRRLHEGVLDLVVKGEALVQIDGHKVVLLLCVLERLLDRAVGLLSLACGDGDDAPVRPPGVP